MRVRNQIEETRDRRTERALRGQTLVNCLHYYSMHEQIAKSRTDSARTVFIQI